MKILGTPTHQHHFETYGEDFPVGILAYFNFQSQRFDPGAWTELFKFVGVRYVVLTAKHHEDFMLWTSDIPDPNSEDCGSKRDIVGDLAGAVRAAGLRMGIGVN